MSASTIPAAKKPTTPNAPALTPEVRGLVELAQRIQRITTPEQRAEVGRLHAKISQERRDNAELMEAVSKPLYKKYQDARAPFKLAVDTCQLWETHCENSMKAWDREQVRIARQKQDEENRRTNNANNKAIEKAEEKGVAPIIKAPKIIETAAPKTVVTEDGSSSSRRTVKTWTVQGVGPDEDLTRIPASDPRLASIDRANLVLNMTRINQLVRAGEVPTGITVYDDYDYTGRGGGK